MADDGFHRFFDFPGLLRTLLILLKIKQAQKN